MFRSSRQYISQYSHCIIRTTEPYVERVKAVNQYEIREFVKKYFSYAWTPGREIGHPPAYRKKRHFFLILKVTEETIQL